MADLTPKTISELPSAGTHTGTEVLALLQGGASKKSTIADLVYPVGSIYMSVNSISPATLFGGTWARIKDTFLLAAGDTYAPGDTGGSASHTLAESELPAHSHFLTTTNNTGDIANPGSSLKMPSGYGATNDELGYTLAETSETGSGDAFSTLPPYLAVYVWKRTA